jgi:hypothetical protein
MNDPIDRQAAIDAFMTATSDGDKAEWCRWVLKQLPSAQPERPKGHWMLCDNQRREDIENGNYMYTCTNCLHSDVHAKTVTVPFCWNCGADMREDTDDQSK